MPMTDSEQLKHHQYQNVDRLSARIRLHERFSTNKVGMFPWLFDALLNNIPSKASILEIGCGRGDLWAKNFDQIPSAWQIKVTDFSPGMLDDCQTHLGDKAARFEFAVVDAQAIPYPDAHFDAVIANFMLYHVPNRPEAIREFRRVIKPSGKLFAMTVGETNLLELLEIIHLFAPDAPSDIKELGFTLQNGGEQLRLAFSDVQRNIFPDGLYVTELQPLLDYIASGTTLWDYDLSNPHTQTVVNDLEERLRREGGIHIQKQAGLFTASG